MPVPTNITDCDTNAANNSPPGTESAKGNIDNYLRQGFAFIRQLYDAVSGKAAKGANSDITSLSGLTTALSVGQGGTGATTAAAARSALGAELEPGMVAYFARSTAPTGWLKANGATGITRAAYPNLDAAIYCGDAANPTAPFGYRYTDPANPSGTRNINGAYIMIPDGRSEFFRGLDDGRGIDAGRVLGSAQADAFKSHNHPRNTIGTSEAVFTNRVSGNDAGNVAGTRTYDDVGNVTGSTGGTETRPRNIAFLACIKY